MALAGGLQRAELEVEVERLLDVHRPAAREAPVLHHEVGDGEVAVGLVALGQEHGVVEALTARGREKTVSGDFFKKRVIQE